jgi:peptidoglycan hydrolase CwlO-like protein
MKTKSGILAILVSLSIFAPAKAGVWDWMVTLGGINLAQYVVPQLPSLANLWLTYRNGQKIDGVAAQVTALDGKVTGVQTTLNSVDFNVRSVQTQVGTMNETLDGVNSKVVKLDAWADTMNESVDEVKQVVNKQAEDFQKYMEKYTSDIQGLNQNVTETKAGVGRLEADMFNMQARLGRVETDGKRALQLLAILVRNSGAQMPTFFTELDEATTTPMGSFKQLDSSSHNNNNHSNETDEYE